MMIHPKTTAELIADALRSLILQGKLRSGQSLKQDEIANDFQVSKIPVREALVQLQAEGLVRMIPSRGATVSRLTLAEVQEIYMIRSALEPLALQRSIDKIKPMEFHQMEQILSHIDIEEDMSKWAELNWQFHAMMYRAAGLPRLVNTVQALYNNVARYLLNNYLDRAYLEESQRQHREILDACLRKDIDDAVEKLLFHLGDPVQVFAGLLDEQ
jgi:DNA-binding GntR family transcriptional regulator